MTQEQANADAEAQHDAQTGEQQDSSSRTDLNTLPEDVQEYIRELRREARKANDAKKEAAREKEAAERDRLAKAQEWEALAKQYEQDLNATKPRAERVDAMEQLLLDMAQKRIDRLPKQYRSLVPEYDDPVKTLAWLDANEATLTTPVPPNTGAGVQGEKKPAPPTEAAQRAATLAAQYGYTVDPAKISARAQELEQQRQRKPQGE